MSLISVAPAYFFQKIFQSPRKKYLLKNTWKKYLLVWIRGIFNGKIGSRSQIALLFLFYRNFQRPPPLIWFYLMFEPPLKLPPHLLGPSFIWDPRVVYSLMSYYKCTPISINASDTTEYLVTKNKASTILQSTKKIK